MSNNEILFRFFLDYLMDEINKLKNENDLYKNFLIYGNKKQLKLFVEYIKYKKGNNFYEIERKSYIEPLIYSFIEVRLQEKYLDDIKRDSEVLEITKLMIDLIDY